MTTPRNETYLGDGLYVSFDGFLVILRAPRGDGNHWVALEPAVLESFLSYLRSLTALDHRIPRLTPEPQEKDSVDAQ